VGRTSPRSSVGPTFYRVNYRAIYVQYTRLVEAFGWSPDECKALTIRERRYWIEYMTYKNRMENYRRSMVVNG
jgi:hypothetical protein